MLMVLALVMLLLLYWMLAVLLRKRWWRLPLMVEVARADAPHPHHLFGRESVELEVGHHLGHGIPPPVHRDGRMAGVEVRPVLLIHARELQLQRRALPSVGGTRGAHLGAGGRLHLLRGCRRYLASAGAFLTIAVGLAAVELATVGLVAIRL